jgi:hypothetical protein
MRRQLQQIAREVRADWAKVNYAAEPYLNAMAQMGDIREPYYADEGYSVVAYFLANAQGWRGAKAKEIKAELNAQLKEVYAR